MEHSVILGCMVAVVTEKHNYKKSTIINELPLTLRSGKKIMVLLSLENAVCLYSQNFELILRANIIVSLCRAKKLQITC